MADPRGLRLNFGLSYRTIRWAQVGLALTLGACGAPTAEVQPGGDQSAQPQPPPPPPPMNVNGVHLDLPDTLLFSTQKIAVTKRIAATVNGSGADSATIDALRRSGALQIGVAGPLALSRDTVTVTGEGAGRIVLVAPNSDKRDSAFVQTLTDLTANKWRFRQVCYRPRLPSYADPDSLVESIPSTSVTYTIGVSNWPPGTRWIELRGTGTDSSWYQNQVTPRGDETHGHAAHQRPGVIVYNIPAEITTPGHYRGQTGTPPNSGCLFTFDRI